jgi:ERCC4-type nuclease
MTVLLWGMVLALLIPLAVVCRPCTVWDRLAAFGSIQKLRKATAEEIAEVGGVSTKLAADIVDYLAKRV